MAHRLGRQGAVVNRRQLAHILRAAADVSNDPHILVIGSQAILATFDATELPEAATMSVEADIAFFDDEDNGKSDRVEGAIGEDSKFHQAFGYYGQGVTIMTATLPAGWRDRLVPFVPIDSEPARALCLDPLDLVIAKLVAGRAKDISYAAGLLDGGLVDADGLARRVEMLEVVGGVKARVARLLERLVERHGL